MTRKKVLIVFSDVWLPYSLSTLNLFYALKGKGIDVTLLACEPSDAFSSQRLSDPDVEYVTASLSQTDLEGSKPGGLLSRLRNKIFNRTGPPDEGELKRRSLLSLKAASFIENIRKQNADSIIAVDSFSLWCAQQIGKAAHFLSLEIREPDPYFDDCNLARIESVLIQTEERYRYVFNGATKPPFTLLPNSPAFLDFSPSYHEREKNSLVYCGSAIAEFGVFSCIDLISDYPQYTLTIKGAVPEDTREGIDKYYSHLLRENRLTIDNSYADPIGLTRFISGFWAGLAFYDFYRFPFYRKFNYRTAPSGKLYQYFNAGVPVVGNQLPGFKIIEESNVGRLIPYLSSLQMKHALEAIEANYYDMSIRAKQLSREFDSNVYLDRFINTYILK